MGKNQIFLDNVRWPVESDFPEYHAGTGWCASVVSLGRARCRQQRFISAGFTDAPAAADVDGAQARPPDARKLLGKHSRHYALAVKVLQEAGDMTEPCTPDRFSSGVPGAPHDSGNIVPQKRDGGPSEFTQDVAPSLG